MISENNTTVLWFLEAKFRNGLATKMWGRQWIYKCLLQIYYLTNWWDSLGVWFLYSASIIHLTNFIFLIGEVIDIRMCLFVPYTPTDVKLAKGNFQYPRNLVRLNHVNFYCFFYPLYTSSVTGKKNWMESMLMDSPRLRLNLKPKVQAWRLQNAGPAWYSNKTLKISSKLRLGLAVAASLLMRMI